MNYKVQNPIGVIYKDGKYEIIKDEVTLETVSLERGFMINGENYGFVIATDLTNVYSTKPFATERKIAAIALDGAYLKIFEYGKRNPWVFRSGIFLRESSFDENCVMEFNSDVIAADNYKLFGEVPQMKSPLNVVINRNFKKSVVEFLEGGKRESFPLSPAAFLGGEHYGFKIIRDTKKGLIIKEQPTQKPIDALGIEALDDSTIKIYEDTMWNPWKLDSKGSIVSPSSYNIFSRKDIRYVSQYLNDHDEEKLNIKTR